MAKIGRLEITISGKTAKLEKATKKAGKHVDSLGERMRKAGNLLAGAFAVRAISNFGKESVKMYNVQKQSEAQLLTALKGRKDVQQRLIKQAEELQSKTLFGDEETIKAQALLANLNIQEDQIKGLTKLTQDFAAEQGIGLAQAAQRVQRVIGQGSDTFKKYGADLSTTSSQSENASTLIATMGKRLEGTAASAAKAGTGPLQQLGNSLGDIREEIGGALMPMLTSMADKIKMVADYVADNNKIIRIATKVIARVGAVLVTARIAMLAFNAAMSANAIGAILTALTTLAALFVTAWQESEVFRAKLKYAAESVGFFFKKAWAGIKMGVKTLFDSVKAYFESIATSASTLWKAIKAIFTKGKSPGEVLREGFNKTKKDIKNIGKDARKAYEKELKSIEKPDYEKILAKEEAKKKGKDAGEEASKGFDEGFSPEGETPGVDVQKKDIGIGGAMDDTGLFGAEEQRKQAEEMQKMKAELDVYLEKQKAIKEEQDAINEGLATMGTNLVDSFMKGENMAKAFEDTLKQLVKQIILAIAKQAILTALTGGAGIASGAGKGLSGFNPLAAVFGGGGTAAQMAKGGQVPGGFANDTYPALLSSGETVIPPKSLKSVINTQSAQGGGRLEAIVSGSDLKFILDRNAKNNDIIT